MQGKVIPFSVVRNVSSTICFALTYCYMRPDRKRKPEKPPLLGKSCETRCNTRANAKQLAHATTEVILEAVFS
jgi:hypothetical protein